MDPVRGVDCAGPTRHLVLYARVPRTGTVKTRLVPYLSPAEALDLHRALILDSLRILRVCAGSGARPAVAFSEAWEPEVGDPLSGPLAGLRRLPQVAGSLGDRLEATLAALLAEPGARAVVIGSDSPDLPPALVDRAFLALDRADLVLGPATDGGFYLVGSRTHSPGLLDGVAWGTAMALADLRRVAADRGLATAILDPWSDIDLPGDLRALAVRLEAAPATAPATAALIATMARDDRSDRRP